MMDRFSEIRNFLENIVNTAYYKAEQTSINNLNDDYLRITFSYLDNETLLSENFQLVCKRWFLLSNRLIYCRPKLSLFCGSPQKSNENGAVSINNSIFSLAQALYFSDSVVDDLVLSSTHESRYPFSDQLFETITSLCPNLVKLTLDNFVRLWTDKPEEIPFSFPNNLQELSIKHIWLKENTLDCILKLNNVTLQKLILVRCGLIRGSSITENLAECHLKIIDLSFCGRIHSSVVSSIFRNYNESLEELHFSSSHIEEAIPSELIMKKLRSVTLYELYQFGCVIPTHDDDVMWSYFRAMKNVEVLSILTFDNPHFRMENPSKYFDYLGKIKTLKKLKELTLPVEPLRHGMFGDNSIMQELRSAGVKIRINTDRIY